HRSERDPPRRPGTGGDRLGQPARHRPGRRGARGRADRARQPPRRRRRHAHRRPGRGAVAVDPLAADGVRAGDLPGLPGDGVAVRVAAAPVRDPVHHPAGAGRRGAGAAADALAGVGGGVHRPDPDGRSGGQERDHPDRQGQPAARGGRGQARGAGGGRALAPAADHDDHPVRAVWLPAAGAGLRRGRGGALPDGDHGDRRAAGLDPAHPGGDPGGLRPARPAPGRVLRQAGQARRMNITELSIRRPVTTVMFFVSMLVIGLIAAVRLPLESMPEATIPFFFVQLPYSGSTPEEVERNLVRPVEEALATMSGIESMNSRAEADGGSVQVRFSDWSRNVAIAASEARERIDAIRDQLPDDFQRYFVWRWSNSDDEAMSLRLTSDGDLTTRGDLLERNLKRRLERLPGVARVEVEGVARQEVEVAISPE